VVKDLTDMKTTDLIAYVDVDDTLEALRLPEKR
jgi:hypothetical protein